MEFRYRDLSFLDMKDSVRVSLYKLFYFDMPKSELAKIGSYKIEKHAIIFDNGKKSHKFVKLLDKGFDHLVNPLNGHRTIFIYKGSGIPLIGSNAFGIIDRGTNLIEIKPVTGCNLDCVFCSVDQNKRIIDYVVEKEYMLEELNKLIDIKQNPVEVHIGCQGEPFIYGPITELIRGIKSRNKVNKISVDTNGTFLTKKRVDELAEAGLSHFNISINAMDEDAADRISGRKYPTKSVLEVCRHIAQVAHVNIAPVWVDGVNDDQIEDIIIFAKKIGATVGIQNYLVYDHGRRIAKQLSFDDFFFRLRKLEQKHDVKLILSAEDFSIVPDKTLPKPFVKGDIVEAEILMKGRMPKEMIAVAQERVITIPDCKKKGNIKIKITRSKHNIFYGLA